MHGATLGRAPARPGETANQAGNGAIGEAAPGEVSGVERSEVPEEYREQVGRYFQPRSTPGARADFVDERATPSTAQVAHAKLVRLLERDERVVGLGLAFDRHAVDTGHDVAGF